MRLAPWQRTSLPCRSDHTEFTLNKISAKKAFVCCSGCAARKAIGTTACPRGVDAIVALLIGRESSATTEAAASLLDEARMSAGNDASEGEALLDAAEAAFVARDAAVPFAPKQRLRLAQVYARAGLAPPAFAQLSPNTMPVPEDGNGDTALPDIADLLDPLLAEIGDHPCRFMPR